MSDNKIEEFKRHRMLEDDYWNAMNDGRYYRCSEIDRMMSYEIKHELQGEYKAWLTKEEKKEAKIANLEKEIEKIRSDTD